MAVGLPAAHALPARCTPRGAAASPAAAAGDVEVLRSLRRAMAQSMALSRDSVMGARCSTMPTCTPGARGSDYTTRVLRAITRRRARRARTECLVRRAVAEPHTVRAASTSASRWTPIDGLLVPVIRHVREAHAPRSCAPNSTGSSAPRANARVGGEELRNFTFMLSNFGTHGRPLCHPVVVPPAVAILGTGRVRRDVIAAGERVEIHPRMPLSLTFDHRVVTGGEAVRFLGAVHGDLELPE